MGRSARAHSSEAGVSAHRQGDFAPAASPERARIRAATMALVVEHGFEGTSAATIAARAEVSVAGFERHFADPRDCCIQVYLANIAEFDRIVFAAVQREQGWRERLRASAYAALRHVRDSPLEARFNLIQILAIGEMAQAFRDRYVERIVDLIDAGRQELDHPDSMSRGVAEGAFGAVYEFLVKQFHDGGDISYIDRFVPELMYIAVRPYVGHQSAREELSIPAPAELGEGEGDRASDKDALKPDWSVQTAALPRYRPPVSKREPPPENATPGLARLPPGRHGLPREFVAENQRGRLVAGVIAAVAEHGYHEASISEIAARAGVSRRTFYGYFSSKEQCFFDTYDLIAAYLRGEMNAAGAEHGDWREQIRAGLGALLAAFAANPDLARFCLIAPLTAGEEIAARYRLAMKRLLSRLTAVLPPPPVTRSPSQAAEESLIGGIATLIVAKVKAGEGERLPELLPDLLELTLTPYLGREEAAQVARHSAP